MTTVAYATLPTLPDRRIIQFFDWGGCLLALCSDGTVWGYTPKGYERLEHLERIPEHD